MESRRSCSNSDLQNKAAVSNEQIHAAAVRAAQHHPQIVVIGSVDLPSLLIFIHTFEAMKYTPNIMIAASGPDQGQAFLNKLNPFNAQDIMVPDGWFGGDQNALSHVMVEDYIAKYGGTSADINADVAEAYSAGEVLADAVKATGTTDNRQIIKLPAQPGHAADRAGTGEIPVRRREPQGPGLHFPVAEQRPVRSGAGTRHGDQGPECVEAGVPDWLTSRVR